MYIHNITSVIYSTATVVSTRHFGRGNQVQPEEKFADLSELHHARLGEFMHDAVTGGSSAGFQWGFLHKYSVYH
jgi:hypothetical protein